MFPLRRRSISNMVFALAGRSRHRWWVETLLTCRALLYIGRRHVCPCCGWKLRTFTRGGASLRARDCGYCPRCNSKARHRRDWLYLVKNTALFEARGRLLHVGPKYALSRQFIKSENLDYVGVDCKLRPNIRSVANIEKIPFRDGVFDAIVCIHVLEHVEDDRSAISELFRVLKPGGWAFVTVPIRLDAPTYEDPTITTPQARREAFGEEQHVRVYGYDLADRLKAEGVHVQLDRADRTEASLRKKYGVLDNEHIFFCTKETS